jgi:hypothetical protein
MEEHYIFLLDNSTSMIGSYISMSNIITEFIYKLKSLTSSKNVYITLIVFSNEMKWILRRINVRDIDRIKSRDFLNGGTTSLYDSVCTCILGIGLTGSPPENRHLYIITDGYDNSSNKFTQQDAQKWCDLAIKMNWKIKHFDTLEYNSLEVPKVKYDPDDIASLLEGLTI